MLGQRREEDIPALVTGRVRLSHQQRRPGLWRLPAVLLQELGDQEPVLRLVSVSQEPGQRRDGHRLVLRVLGGTRTIVHTCDGSTGRARCSPTSGVAAPDLLSGAKVAPALSR